MSADRQPAQSIEEKVHFHVHAFILLRLVESVTEGTTNHRGNRLFSVEESKSLREALARMLFAEEAAAHFRDAMRAIVASYGECVWKEPHSATPRDCDGACGYCIARKALDGEPHG